LENNTFPGESKPVKVSFIIEEQVIEDTER
jgi:hypothetical protein